MVNFFRKSQQNYFEVLKNMSFIEKIEKFEKSMTPAELGEKILSQIENDSVFSNENQQIFAQNPFEKRKTLEENYKKYSFSLDCYFKKLIQTPQTEKQFVNLLQITEKHKKTLQKLEVLYARALEELEKAAKKEKTPKFYSEISPNLPTFNFS